MKKWLIPLFILVVIFFVQKINFSSNSLNFHYTGKEYGNIRLDIGDYKPPTDVKFLQGNGHWNWISFPCLPRKNNDPFNLPKLFGSMMPTISALILQAQGTINFTYDMASWSNPEYTVISTKGYKLQIEDNGQFMLPEKGTRLDNSYEIYLNAGENWVGYWLPGSMDWELALGQYKDRFTQIQAENWAMTKVNGKWMGPTNASFTYGRGYIMYVDGKTYPNGFYFHWTYSEKTGMVFEKTKVKNFTYEEKPDYEVIDIESIKDEKNIDEIGAFVNGICVGASKVKEYPVQILAYTENINQSGDYNSIYFKVISKKGTTKKINDITEYNRKTGKFEKSILKARKSLYHLIRLGNNGFIEYPVSEELSLENYPNPFNLSTTISYSIPQDSKTKLQIFNSKGKLVKTLVKGVIKKGKYNAVWNGFDNTGKKVSSGIYMCKLSTKDKSISKKMLMIN